MNPLSIQSRITGIQDPGYGLSYGSLTTFAAVMIAFTSLTSFWSESVGEILKEVLEWDKRSTLTKIFILVLLLFIFIMIVIVLDRFFFHKNV